MRVCVCMHVCTLIHVTYSIIRICSKGAYPMSSNSQSQVSGKLVRGSGAPPDTSSGVAPSTFSLAITPGGPGTAPTSSATGIASCHSTDKTLFFLKVREEIRQLGTSIIPRIEAKHTALLCLSKTSRWLKQEQYAAGVC